MDDTELQETLEEVTYGSIANDLQPTIATWYNALRRIALVGLLSVLVYIGIQIILTSASGKENSKYKKMLVDWLIALCLLFTLHYIMNVTLVITQKISSVLNNGETDNLLNTLRNQIAQVEEYATWEEVVSQVIMYVLMTIFTIMFSFQYLKRVVYMAFFTMIAPLITLTYPLDKIKDSKAQAFTMWIREFIFNALIQVVHLVVYYTLVGSALNLVDAYPIYGVLAIGFMTQGEKIVRKMFGFNNATTVGTMEAAATGGLIAAALNKLQKISKPNKKTENSKESPSNNNNIRTVSNNIANSLRKIDTEDGNNNKTKSGPDKKGGAKSLAGRYTVPVLKAAGKGPLKTMTTAPGAMLGFAGGVAQGDVSAALQGALAGGAIGNGLAQGGIRLASNLGGKIQDLGNDIKDTYNEGAYGTEYAQNIKMVREFKQTSDYKELKQMYGDQLTDDKLSEILQAAMAEKSKK